MNFEIRNLICDIELIKERFDDIKTVNAWFEQEHFTHEGDYVLNRNEVMEYGMKYHEHRIHNTQTIDLMTMYLEQFDDLIKKFHEIEKASCENFSEESQNANNKNDCVN